MIFDFRLVKPLAKVLPIIIFGGAFIWYAALALRFHTRGAIGDDPATYVQMARDIANRGTVIPEFSLLTNLYQSGVSWDALILPGYHIVQDTGMVAPNFAFGFPLLLALAMRVFGEGASDWATPLMGALSLAVTFALGAELWRDFLPVRRYAISALAVLLLATTPKQIQLALVPMSDVPAQLFCVLAVWCALRVSPRVMTPMRVGNAVFATLCGFCLGVAYLIRHSALVLIVPLAIVATRWQPGSTRQRVVPVLVAVIALALTSAPDLMYRAQVLGSILAVESPESSRMVLANAPRQFLEMLGALFSVTGFGPIVLLAPVAWWVLARNGNRFEAILLLSWTLAFVGFHSPLYLTGVFENNMRYLVPAYPAIVLSISAGVVWILEGALERFPKTLLRSGEKGAVLFYVGSLFVLITGVVAVRALASPERFVARAYGWMSETARHDLSVLNLRLPPNAVIGVSDQMAGSTRLYAQRDIFRPASFREPTREFSLLVAAMQNENRPIFLLGDWNCSPLAGADEKLPDWLANYETQATGAEIRDLPYECAQRVREVQE